MNDNIMTELVSIVIPVYNGSNYVKHAIESALSQTYPNVEVIVVNDGSNDDGATERVALQFGDSIRYIKKENGGVASALNCGIKAMRGSWFSWLSHDDLYDREKIAYQMQAINSLYSQDKSLICAYCGNRFVDKFGKTLPKKQAIVSCFAGKVIDPGSALKLASKGNFFSGCNFLLPRQVMLDHPFNEELRYIQDIELWARLFRSGMSVLYDPEHVLVSTRIHSEQGQSVMGDRWKTEIPALAEIVIPFLASQPHSKMELLRYMMRRLLKLDYASAEIARKFLIEKGMEPFSISVFGWIATVAGRLRGVARQAYYRVLNVRR